MLPVDLKKKKEDFSCVLFRVLGVNVLRVPIKCTRWKSPRFPMKEVFCPFLAQAKRPGSERGLWESPVSTLESVNLRQVQTTVCLRLYPQCTYADGGLSPT